MRIDIQSWDFGPARFKRAGPTRPEVKRAEPASNPPQFGLGFSNPARIWGEIRPAHQPEFYLLLKRNL